MDEKRFNPEKLDKLNNPLRRKDFPLEFIFDQTKLNTPDVIIDLGAGTGFFSIPFAQEFKECKIYACDISDVMVNWMNANIVQDNPNIIPMLMDNNKITLGDNIADLLFMVSLHHELDSPVETLKECCRLLKDGGIIVISDWKKEDMQYGPPKKIRCNPEDVAGQLSEAGFVKIHIYTEFPNNFMVIAVR